MLFPQTRGEVARWCDYCLFEIRASKLQTCFFVSSSIVPQILRVLTESTTHNNVYIPYGFHLRRQKWRSCRGSLLPFLPVIKFCMCLSGRQRGRKKKERKREGLLLTMEEGQRRRGIVVALIKTTSIWMVVLHTSRSLPGHWSSVCMCARVCVW